MRTSQKGFTLVELIVVITILAILGTIAFISLQGYSQDAKNSKVTSDIRTLVSAVETGVTDGSFTLATMVNTAGSGTLASGQFWSGVTLTAGVNADVGSMNFAVIRQNGADFKDGDGNDYVVAYASDPADTRNTFYQIVGQTTNPAGTFDAVVRGNYVQVASTDVVGLVAGTGFTAGVTWNTTGMAAPGIYID